MEYKITATRYSKSGEAMSAEHSTVVNTESEEYLEGVNTKDDVCEAFESYWNVPQDDGSKIKVDLVERVL